MTSILKRKLNNRLMELCPRAFEFFAGDLLEYLGLESVRVTRLSGDGGIDAECRMVSGGLVQVPAGVQVKRQKQPVGRPVIDRFIGALANRYSCGIFVTTSAFSQPAREKAQSSIPYVSPIDGAMVAGIMVVGRIGVLEKTQALDEGYFSAFEERVERARSKASYPVHQPPRVDVTPADDLISLRALSHALHVDTTTIRDWIDKGRLSPDDRAGSTKGQGIFFRRQRIQELRERYRLEPAPSSTDEWVTHFLRFATSAQMRMSYKPVMLLALLDIVDSDGTVTEDALVRSFLTYYRTRQEAGLVAEGPTSALSRPDQVTLSEVRRILMTYPLERFVIKGFLERQPEAGSIRFRQEIWDNLRHGEVLALRRSLQELIARYFASLDDSST